MVAGACAAQGLSVTCLSPDYQVPWENNYGSWSDELVLLGGEQVAATQWPGVEVLLGSGPSRVFSQGYASLCSKTLQAHLLEQCQRQGVTFLTGAAEGVEHTEQASQVTTQAGAHGARVVIDATGGAAKLLERSGSSTAAQVAFGRLIEVDEHPYALDRMRWMDFQDEHLPAQERHLPTFLYAMPFSDRLLFVEETSLVGSPPMPMEALIDRLRLRLAASGVNITRVLSEERCFIPMDMPIPSPQRVVGFGASAAMVHSATGYMLPRASRAAPQGAAAIAAGLERSPRHASERAWQTIWSPDELRKVALIRLGTRFLCGLSGHDTRAFFSAFFSLPVPTWKRYMTGDCTAQELAITMLATFSAAGLSTQLQLAQAAASSPLHALYRSVTGR